MKRIERLFAVLILTVVMVIAASKTSFAYGWQQDTKGWWYGTNSDNSSYYANGWFWIDDNGDSIAECYYFGPDGYIYVNTITPDGCLVNANGQWIDLNGIVQTKATTTSAAGTGSGSTSSGSGSSSTGGSSVFSSSFVGALPYVGNANSKKFHYSNCDSVQKMASYNRVDLSGYTRDQIIAMGYTPCGGCNP